MGQMGIWQWQCTPTGPDNSTELRMEKIRQAVTKIWVPQVWQPPARPPGRQAARPPGPWRQYPSSPEGWGVKMCWCGFRWDLIGERSILAKISQVNEVILLVCNQYTWERILCCVQGSACLNDIKVNVEGRNISTVLCYEYIIYVHTKNRSKPSLLWSIFVNTQTMRMNGDCVIVFANM